MSTVSVASGLRLRPASQNSITDLLFLVDLRNRLAQNFLASEPATVEKTRQLVCESRTYILEVDGRLAGAYALYNHDGKGLEFGRFMLEPWAQGNGYGRAMLEHAIEKARRYAVRRLHLVTKPQNEVACELYEEQGFEVTQVRMELRLD